MPYITIKEVEGGCTFVASQEDDRQHFDDKLTEVSAKDPSKFHQVADLGDCFIYKNDTHYIVNDCGLQTLYRDEPDPKKTAPETKAPPIGLVPEWLHKEQRLKDIDAAIERYREAFATPNPEWLTEKCELEKWLEERKTKKNG